MQALDDPGIPDHRLMEFEFPRPALAQLRDRRLDHLRVEIEHPPGAAKIADRNAVMDFARIHGNGIARSRLHRSAPARRFLGAGENDADAILVMRVARKDMTRIGSDGGDARHAAGENPEVAARRHSGWRRSTACSTSRTPMAPTKRSLSSNSATGAVSARCMASITVRRGVPGEAQ